jgi:hypothetical protein
MKWTVIRSIGDRAALLAALAVLGSGFARAQIYTSATSPGCTANSTGAGCTNYLGAGRPPNPSQTWLAASTCQSPCASAGMAAEDSFDSEGCSQNIPWVGNGSVGQVPFSLGNWYVFATMEATKVPGNNMTLIEAIANCGQQEFGMPSLAWTLAAC